MPDTEVDISTLSTVIFSNQLENFAKNGRKSKGNTDIVMDIRLRTVAKQPLCTWGDFEKVKPALKMLPAS